MFGFNKNVCQDVKKQNDQNKISYNFIVNTGKGSVSMRNGVHFYIKTIPDKMYTCIS